MFCPYCGNSVEDGNKFCSVCGKGLTAEVGENPYLVQETGRKEVSSRLNEKLRSPLLLAVCILFTVSAVTYFLAALPESVSFPVFEILFAIFFWILYAKARGNAVSSSHIRNVSGTVFAGNIVSYVSGGTLIFLSLAASSLMEMLLKTPEFMEVLRKAAGIDSANEALFQQYLEILPTIFSIVCFVAGIAVILVTFFGLRRIHGYTKSLYRNFDDVNQPVKHVSGASVWLIVLGILQMISGLGGGTLLLVISTVCSGVAYLLCGILIPKLTSAE